VKPSGTTLLGVRAESATIEGGLHQFMATLPAATVAARAVMDSLRERTASLVHIACHLPLRPR
jgi:hypothetical protein